MTGEVARQRHTEIHLQSDGRADSTRTASESRGSAISNARRRGGGSGGGGGNPSATHSANRHHIRRLLDMI